MQAHAASCTCHARPGNLLHHNHAIAIVVHARAPILLRHIEAQKTLLAGFEPQFARNMPVLLPLCIMGNNLLLHKMTIGITKELMFFHKERSLHLLLLRG
jgi:hypothetical protein